MNPDVPLDPNLVKALIASESGFEPTQLANKKNSNSARGLMQVTNDSRKLLGGDHYKGVKLAKTREKADGMKDIFNRFYKDLQRCGKA